MASVPQRQPVKRPTERPRLVFFYSPLSGRCRRVEGFIAQVLQRRQNHDTFDLVRVSVERRPDLAEKFRVEQVPTICVVDGRKLRRAIVAPRGCRELEQELEPWLTDPDCARGTGGVEAASPTDRVAEAHPPRERRPFSKQLRAAEAALSRAHARCDEPLPSAWSTLHWTCDDRALAGVLVAVP